jgi:spermidine synthase
MKKVLGFGFLLMGFSFTVTQGLLIRELLVAFFGNELAIGLILGNWLVLEAIGSGLLGRLADRWRGRASAYAALQVLFALFLPLCLYAAYSVRRIVGVIPGEGIGLVPVFYSSFLLLAPLALVDGAMFAFGSKIYSTLTRDEAPAIGRVYVYEALGAIVGGIVFTYLFITYLYSLQIVLVLSGLNLLSAALILGFQTSARRALPGKLSKASEVLRGPLPLTPGLLVVLILLIASFGFLFSPLANKAQHWALRQQWPGYDLVFSENSVYGNVAVIEREGQYTFYTDGIPVLTAPVPDLTLSEEIVHLPMLFVPQPRRALVLSGGVGGVLNELARYPLERIDYAELDPLLIQAVSDFPTPLTQAELSDPRVVVEHVDGRLLVKEKTWETPPLPGARYDLIILNLPYPSTLQLNRFYTLEFFHMLRELLAEDGLLVIGCPGTLTYMSRELRDLNAMAYRTLSGVFPYVRPIPGDLTLWLASPSDELAVASVDGLVERWEGRELDTQLLTASHIRLRLDQRYLDWFWASLDETEEKALVNRDLHPVGLFYGLSYWNALFSPGLARVFAVAGRLKLWMLSVPIMGGILLFLAILKLTGKGKGGFVPIAIATTGFTGMAADLIIVFAFQTLYGYVYHWIGLIIAAFMGGLSLGGVLMTRRLAVIRDEKSALLRLELALVLFWMLMPLALSTVYLRSMHPLIFSSIQWALLVTNALAGFLVGSQFPLANKMWLKGRDAGGGVLYACDLVGAFLGSIIVSVALIPVLGIVETCLLAAVLKLGSLLLVAKLPSGF